MFPKRSSPTGPALQVGWLHVQRHIHDSDQAGYSTYSDALHSSLLYVVRFRQTFTNASVLLRPQFKPHEYHVSAQFVKLLKWAPTLTRRCPLSHSPSISLLLSAISWRKRSLCVLVYIFSICQAWSSKDFSLGLKKILFSKSRSWSCYATRARLCDGKSSVRPSVTFRYRDHIGWNTSKIISRPKSLIFLLG